MPEILAGFVCGFALSLAATPAIAIAAVRSRTTSPLMQQLVPEGTNLIALSVVINLFLVLACTAIGLLLGLLLAGMEDSRPAGGLGSPNRIFTAFVIATTVIAVLPLSVASRRFRMPLLVGGLLFAGIFGWFMPYLASWSPVES